VFTPPPLAAVTQPKTHSMAATPLANETTMLEGSASLRHSKSFT